MLRGRGTDESRAFLFVAVVVIPVTYLLCGDTP
jgi:hypothetical protein